VDTFSDSALMGAAIDPGSAAGCAEVRKRERYRGLTDRYTFQPIAVETTGVLGPSTLEFLQQLGRRITSQTGDVSESSWLLQRISIAVVRGNAASIMAT